MPPYPLGMASPSCCLNMQSERTHTYRATPLMGALSPRAANRHRSSSLASKPYVSYAQVELPGLSSAAEIALDIAERSFKLIHEGSGYRLEIQLPLPVLSEQVRRRS